MNMKAKLVGLIFVMSAACAFALAPVVASANCHCKKSKCHKTSHSKKKSAMENSKQTGDQQTTDASSSTDTSTTTQ